MKQTKEEALKKIQQEIKTHLNTISIEERNIRNSDLKSLYIFYKERETLKHFKQNNHEKQTNCKIKSFTNVI